MYVVIVSLRVKPDMNERFLAAIESNSEGARRDEPGCLRFDVHRDNKDPNHYVLYEAYVDEAAFQAHQRTPHFQRWREVSGEYLQPDGRAATFCHPLFQDERSQPQDGSAI